MARRRSKHRSRARSRKTALARSRSYGIVATRNNPAFLLPIIGLVGLAGTGYALYKAYDAYTRITRPIVLVSGSVGVILGYRYGKGIWERLAYTTAGTGLGLLIDGFLNPEEVEPEEVGVWYKPWTWF